MSDFQTQRKQMVKNQLVTRGIDDPRVIQAFLRVPRHKFVPDDLQDQAYDDHPLAIGEEQTISQPYMAALMTQSLLLKGEEGILEIGTGSGYQAAILSCIVQKVYSIERVSSLAKTAQTRLKRLGFNNVFIKVGDGTLGWEGQAPFGAILVTAGAREIPKPILNQLSENGRLVMPAGDRWMQELLRITKRKGGFYKENLGGCVFVPLIGKFGWSEG